MKKTCIRLAKRAVSWRVLTSSDCHPTFVESRRRICDRVLNQLEARLVETPECIASLRRCLVPSSFYHDKLEERSTTKSVKTIFARVLTLMTERSLYSRTNWYSILVRSLRIKLVSVSGTSIGLKQDLRRESNAVFGKTHTMQLHRWQQLAIGLKAWRASTEERAAESAPQSTPTDAMTKIGHLICILMLVNFLYFCQLFSSYEHFSAKHQVLGHGKPRPDTFVEVLARSVNFGVRGGRSKCFTGGSG